MPLVFWLSRLQPGVEPAEYERFLREVDYPAARRVPSIIRYQSIRLQGPAVGNEPLPFDFIDLAEVTDIEAYRHDLQHHPAVHEVHGASGKYVQTVGNVWGVVVEADT